LRNMAKPMGVSEYRLSRAIPARLQESLPSVEEIEKSLKE